MDGRPEHAMLYCASRAGGGNGGEHRAGRRALKSLGEDAEAHQRPPETSLIGPRAHVSAATIATCTDEATASSIVALHRRA